MKQTNVIRLTEYRMKTLPREALPYEEGTRLWNEFGKKVAVDFPSPKTGDQWQLTSQGWVGHIPLSDDVQLTLEPKTELANLFRMLEYAYQLELKVLEGLTGSSSLSEFYERLASILARRVLDRARKGLHRSYVGRIESLPFVRGTMLIREMCRRPWAVRPQCDYQEHTASIEDNQILGWTLHQIARSGSLSERVRPTVRRAYRTVSCAAELKEFRASDCVGRSYDRLKADYQPLHALCRFFLDHLGPAHDQGDREMLPFLVDMAKLFERFVAEWLRAHLPDSLQLRFQDRVHLGDEHGLQFSIDMVLVDSHTGETVAVLDTKYKAKGKVEPADFSQILAYAKMKRCKNGFLVYPTPLETSLDLALDDLRIRSLAFRLDGDLEANGAYLLGRLISALGY